MQQRINDSFKESIQIQIAAAESLPEGIEQATQAIISSLLNGKKILCCGNGGSASNAQQLAASLLNRFEIERPSFPAISLTNDGVSHSAIARDSDYNNVFAKQVRALGQSGDVLVAISTSGSEQNIIKAVEAAVNRDMFIIALTGKDGGELFGLLAETDVEIRIPSNRSARIHEMHMLVIHCLCDLVDQTIFSSHSPTIE